MGVGCLTMRAKEVFGFGSCEGDGTAARPKPIIYEIKPCSHLSLRLGTKKAPVQY